jgi:hypothetical protein
VYDNGVQPLFSKVTAFDPGFSFIDPGVFPYKNAPTR